MNRKLAASVSGALLSLALIASAQAATPPKVFVRVEGAGATLLPQSAVQTTAAVKVKGNACSGSSAGGALDVATGGNWSGSYSASFKDYLVGSILGEAPTGNNFWTLWVNDRSSSTGACSTQLHSGDHELWFDCIADAHFNCTNNPLALSVPAVIRLGSSVDAKVSQLDGAGHSTPFGGASVFGRGVAAVSGADGTAKLVAHRSGVITLQASKSGATPSDPVFVCVYRQRASECGSASSGPRVHVRGIHEHQVFKRGPRELRGTAGPDPSGLTDVSFGLLRRAGHHRCWYFDAQRAAWHRTSCSAPAPRFSLGASASWSYLLPAPLPKGGYRLTVVATDGNGAQTKLHVGSSVLDFTVKR
jgi:hypothetical protein